MTTFEWSVLGVSLAGGLGLGVAAMTALPRWIARRHAELAAPERQSRRRRIDVVAIDEPRRGLSSQDADLLLLRSRETSEEEFSCP
jgi:hypothetical protein